MADLTFTHESLAAGALRHWDVRGPNGLVRFEIADALGFKAASVYVHELVAPAGGELEDCELCGKCWRNALLGIGARSLRAEWEAAGDDEIIREALERWYNEELSSPVPVSEGLQVSGEVGPVSGVVAGSNQAATGAGNGPGGVVPVPVAAHQRECTHQAGCPVHGDVRDCEPVPVAAQQREDEGENRWNEAIDWLLNSRYTADPDIQGPFWAYVDGVINREELGTFSAQDVLAREAGQVKCADCGDWVHTLSSREWCDGCEEEAEQATASEDADELLRRGAAPLVDHNLETPGTALIDMGYMSLPAEIHRAADEHVAGTGSADPDGGQ